MTLNDILIEMFNEVGITPSVKVTSKGINVCLNIETPSEYEWKKEMCFPYSDMDMRVYAFAERILHVWSDFDIEAEVKKRIGDVGVEKGCKTQSQLIDNIKFVEERLGSFVENISERNPPLYKYQKKALIAGDLKAKQTSKSVQSKF